MPYSLERIDLAMLYLNRLLEGFRLSESLRTARRHRRAQSDLSSIQDILGWLDILHNETKSIHSYSTTLSDDNSTQSSRWESTTQSTESQSPYTQPMLWETLIEGILPCVSWDFFVELIDEIECVFSQENPQEFEQRALHPCPVTGEFHVFDSIRRCIQCNAQHCKDCATCFLNDCTLATEDPANLLLKRVNSLAVRRISGVCDRHQCQRGFEPDFQCRCTEYIYSVNHRCETGVFHLCEGCADNSLEQLSNSNTEAVYTARTQTGINVYVCRCGSPADLTKPLQCVICYRRTHFPKRNDFAWMTDQSAFDIFRRDPFFPISPALRNQLIGMAAGSINEQDKRNSPWYLADTLLEN